MAVVPTRVGRGGGVPAGLLSLVFTVLVLFPVLLVGFPHGGGQQVRSAEGGAFGVLCSGGIGYNMAPTASWGKQFGGVSGGDERTGRDLTIQEAFGKSLRFTSYYGEGSGSFLIADKPADKAAPDVTADKKILEGERNIESCLFSRPALSTAAGFFWFADAISNISRAAVSMAFSPSLVCDPSDGKEGKVCLDLLGVIGGKSDDDKSSIIASLTNSLYFPLVSVAAMVAGLAGFWQGVVKRQYRRAFGAVAWTLLVGIVGVVVVSKPTLLVKAPMKASSVAAGCIIGAFSGQPCDGSSSGGIDTETGLNANGQSSSQAACSSGYGSGGGFADAMETTTSAATCQIWKAFVLTPYTVAAFGAGFDDLDTMDGGSLGSKLVSNSGASPRDFCVPLGVGQSLGDMDGGRLRLSGGKEVCNIAAYQLYLMTNAEANGDYPSDPKWDERWYKIVDVAANNPDVWATWSYSSGAGIGKLGLAVLSVIISFMGNSVLIITAFWALVYYIVGILLMAFAPIFMLVGMHPTRGRKIMFGWVEQVLSAVLKYVVSAVFVVVAVGIYGGILSSGSIITSLLFAAIVTTALTMYRREFTEMIGRADMGGRQFSNVIGEHYQRRFGDRRDNYRNLGRSAVGGAIGSALAGGSVKQGALAGVKRNLKRGTNVAANVAREFDNVSNQNRGMLERQVARARDDEKLRAQRDLTGVLRGSGFDESMRPVGSGAPNGGAGVGGSGAPNGGVGGAGLGVSRDVDFEQYGQSEGDVLRDRLDLLRSTSGERDNARSVAAREIHGAVQSYWDMIRGMSGSILFDEDYMAGLREDVAHIVGDGADATRIAEQMVLLSVNSEFSGGLRGIAETSHAVAQADVFGDPVERDRLMLSASSMVDVAGSIGDESAGRLDSLIRSYPGLAGVRDSIVREQDDFMPMDMFESAEMQSMVDWAGSNLSATEAKWVEGYADLRRRENELLSDFGSYDFVSGGGGESREWLRGAIDDVRLEQNRIVEAAQGTVAGEKLVEMAAIGSYFDGRNPTESMVDNVERQHDVVIDADRETMEYHRLRQRVGVVNFAGVDDVEPVSGGGGVSTPPVVAPVGGVGNGANVNNDNSVGNDSSVNNDSSVGSDVGVGNDSNGGVQRFPVGQSFNGSTTHPETRPQPVVRGHGDGEYVTPNTEPSQGAWGTQHGAADKAYSDGDVQRGTEYSTMSERNRRELHQNEELLQGLHPGQGLTRRSIKKARKQLGEQLIGDGFVDGNVMSARQYGRIQSRRDVRGEGLDTSETTGYSKPRKWSGRFGRG